MSRPSIVAISLLALPLLVGSGCASKEASRDKHLKQGDSFVAQGKVQEAIVEYQAARQADPQSGMARKKLADAYIQTNQPAKALPEYVYAADLFPDDAQVQITAGQMLLLAGRFDDAIGRADKVLEKNPRNAEALILKGNGNAGLQKLDDSLKDMEAALRADPSNGMASAKVAVLQYAKRDLPAAEAAFKKAIAVEPDSAIFRLALGQFYWGAGRMVEAERVIKEAVAIDPTNDTANKTLALLYIGLGRTADAEQPLKAVVARNPDSNDRFILVDYYVLTNRTADAKTLLDEITQSPKVELATAAKLRLAALGFMTGDRATTYRLVEEILKRDPRQTEALIAKAQVLQADGKHDEAMAAIRLAVSSNPSSAQAHHILGKLLVGDLQYEDAIAEQKEALKANGRLASANVELARLSIMTGRHADAVGFAQEAIRINPSQPESYFLLARAHLNSGHPDAAEAPIQTLRKSFPDDPAVQSELGRLQLIKGDLASARVSFERALAKNSAEVSAIQGLIIIDLQQKNAPAARKRIEAAVAAHPNDHGLQVLAGRTYLGLEDRASAERVLKQALSANANNLEAYELLATLYVQQNKLPEAVAEFQALSKLQPKSVTYPTMVGMLLYMQGKLDEAKTEYERVLTLDPKYAAAANNLAQIYVDRNENLDAALQLAQTAKAGLPNSHEVSDTLGWIYYKKGVGPSAVSFLKQAVAADPMNPVYHYHLGAAYALNKDKINARQSLQKALQLQPTFPGADDARKILDSVKG